MKTFRMLPVLLILGVNITYSQTAEDLVNVTNKFLNTLNKDELQTLHFDFNDTSRTRWTNLPVGIAKRPGIKYGKLSDESKIQFHHILTTLFSSQGYLKTTSIMKLDDILNEVYETAYAHKEINDDLIKELRALNWGYENYYIAVWGKPDIDSNWGLKFEGHHISINVSAAKNKFSMTPLFLGTDPAEVKNTRYAGLRVLSKEEDYGFLLINSFSPEQKAKATLSQKVPGDLITSPSGKQRLTQYNGIKASELTKEQKDQLEYIIKEYVNNLEHDKAQEYLNKIEQTGIDEIYFAWIGSYEPDKPHYYVLNGPDFIIEYDNVGFQNNGNHIHSIWREKGNDFGQDILKEHYLKEHVH